MSLFTTQELSRIYDGFSGGYDRGRDLFDNRKQLEELQAGLPEPADVLDAGCGSGYPVLQFFSNHGHQVTGSDICASMLKLAAQRAPRAKLVQADSAELDFPDESFDLITSFYSLFHLSMTDQKKVFRSFFRMLRPGGKAYFTLASKEYTGHPVFDGTKEFAGIELPYSHVTPGQYESLLKEAGFTQINMEHLTIGRETMLWVLCRK